MINYEDIIRKLKEENERIDTTDSQRQANEWRLKFLEQINREKVFSESTKSTDVIFERLKDPSYRFTPQNVLVNHKQA